jgi:hypothetical protein
VRRGEVYMGGGFGVDEGARIGTNRGRFFRDLPGVHRVRPELPGRDDKWGPLVSGRRLRIGTGSGRENSGSWAVLVGRPKCCPAAF